MDDSRKLEHIRTRSPGGVPDEISGSGTEGADGMSECESAEAVVETTDLEGGRLLESWDDLLDLVPGERVLVPLESPVGEAVWVWNRSLGSETPPGDMARGIRDILQGLHENQKIRILEGVVTLLTGVARMGWK